jgi:hypothetical protein
MIDKHVADLYKLMHAIKLAVEKSNAKGMGTKTVVVLTSGFNGEFSAEIDECILRMNRAASDAAHLNGFAVLERGEIEKRLMYKSLKAANPILHNEMHLSQPAQNIIATLLMELSACLSTVDMTTELSPEAREAAAKAAETGSPPTSAKHRAPPRPLHSPPS